MNTSWYGTASLRIASASTEILIDPFVPLKGSKVDVTADDFYGASTVVLTHAHIDHISSIPHLNLAPECKIIGTRASKSALKKLGCTNLNTRFNEIAPTDEITVGDLTIECYKGKHIVFDEELKKRTVFSARMLKYIYNLPGMYKLLQTCKEMNETVGYLISDSGTITEKNVESSNVSNDRTAIKRIFVLGSLGYDVNTIYPTDVDLLVIPYQGSSDLLTKAEKIIDIIKPKAIFLDHFDDTFPPVSNTVDTGDIEEKYRGKIAVIKPEYKIRYDV